MQEDIKRVEAEHGRGEDGVVGERLEQQGGHAHGIGNEQQGSQFRAAQGEDVAPFDLRRIPCEEQGAGEQEQGGEGEEGFAVLGHGVGRVWVLTLCSLHFSFLRKLRFSFAETRLPSETLFSGYLNLLYGCRLLF